MSELKRTQLYDVHVQAGATMVDFGGWEMPIQYPSGIVSEHLYTRHACCQCRPGPQEQRAASDSLRRRGNYGAHEKRFEHPDL